MRTDRLRGRLTPFVLGSHAGPARRHLGLGYTPDGLSLCFEFAPNVTVHAVVMCPRGEPGRVIWAASVPGGNSGRVEIGFAALFDALAPELARAQADHREELDASGATEGSGEPLEPHDAGGLRVFGHLGFDIEVPGAGPGHGDRRIVGASGFATSEIAASRPIGRSPVMTPFVSSKGALCIAVGDSAARPRLTGRVTRWARHRNALALSGELTSSSYEVESMRLSLTGRRHGQRLVVPVEFRERTDETVKRHGGRRYRFSAQLDAAAVIDTFTAADLADTTLELSFRYFDEPGSLRLTRASALSRLLLPAPIMQANGKAVELRTYLTFKARSLAFDIQPLDADAVSTVRWAPVLGPALRAKASRPIWLVGERPTTAQDTGLAYFRYLRSHQPQIDARYALDETSPDLAAVEALGGVVRFGSREHARTVLGASRILGSHHPDYLLPARGRAFQWAVTAPRVFLQHGIMGTKNMVANYGYKSPTFSAEAFLVSSQREFDMITEDFGWPPDRVHITGLSRFDRLLGEHPPPENRLLVMPTWRDWLQTPDDVAASEYLERWTALLTSDRFTAFLTDYDLQADLYLHTNLQSSARLFAADRIHLVHHGDVPVQDLLLQSKVMLTDYTSAAIDFALLNRPVVYYQFDRSRFIGARPSHFILDRELPGHIAFRQDTVVDQLQGAARRQFMITDELAQRASALLEYRDQSSSRRITEVAKQPLPHPRRLRISPRARTWALRMLHKRPEYRRLRDLTYEVGRRLPALRPSVFVETNLGADFGDSPGAIAAELQRRHPRLRIVWSRAGDEHGAGPVGPAVRIRRRGSLAQRWAMARATVWISNQNLPSMLRKPRRTHYLQTWHGTPLKRMLHDLDQVVGRDEGYVGRVDTMISEWDTLISPSPWATARFRSAFRYEGKVLEVGYPRNDALTGPGQAERANRVRRQLGLDPSKLTVLYAPTFRDDQKLGNRFTFQIPLDLESVVERLDDTVQLIVRLHPIVRRTARLPAGVINGGGRLDMTDLLCATDVLITDYSSVMFDFVVLDRPMIFFAPDLEHYRDDTRGFYLDYDAQVPGPVLTTTDEVVKALEDPELLDRDARRRAGFRERYCPLDDGRAASRVVDYMEELRLLGRPPTTARRPLPPTFGRSPAPGVRTSTW